MAVLIVDSDFNITVLKVVATNRLYNSVMDTPAVHKKRSRWALALKRTGRTWYTVNGQDVLSDFHHPVILPRGCTYSWRCVEPGECLLIEFDALETAEHIYSFSCTDNSFIVNEFDKLRRALHKTTPDGQLEAMSRVYGLLQQLVKGALKDYVPKGKQQLLRPAVSYIAEHYDEPGITNEQLAALCGISTVYFRKSFASVYGVSPIRYLHDLRIRRAKDMLSSDYGSVSEVAESVGYGSVYHFSKMFKQYTGLSPGQYAKNEQSLT